MEIREETIDGVIYFNVYDLASNTLLYQGETQEAASSYIMSQG